MVIPIRTPPPSLMRSGPFFLLALILRSSEMHPRSLTNWQNALCALSFWNSCEIKRGDRRRRRRPDLSWGPGILAQVGAALQPARSFMALSRSLTLIYDRNVQDACPITFCLSTHPALDRRVGLQGWAVISRQVLARHMESKLITKPLMLHIKMCPINPSWNQNHVGLQPLVKL